MDENKKYLGKKGQMAHERGHFVSHCVFYGRSGDHDRHAKISPQNQSPVFQVRHARPRRFERADAGCGGGACIQITPKSPVKAIFFAFFAAAGPRPPFERGRFFIWLTKEAVCSKMKKIARYIFVIQ